MARRITVKRVLSGIPNISTLSSLTDVNDSDLSNTNAYLKYDSDSGKFIFTSLSAITSGVSTVNSLTGDVTIAGAGSVSVGTAGSTVTITGTDTGVDSTAVNTLIAATDLGDLNNVATTSPSTGQVLKWNGSQWAPGTDNTGAGGAGGTDSAAVSALIDSALNVLDTHDSAAVLGQINNTVNKSFVDNLGVDAATLGGNDSSYYTNASNISTGTLSADRLPTITLGVNTTGNYVSDVSGTTNEIEVSASTGSVTIGLPSNVTIDSNLTVGGYIGGPAVFTIDPAAIGDSTGKVVILGDLQVDGVQTTINSTTVSISDKNIVLADSAADASQADGAGITVNGASATLQYASTGDKWVFNKAPYYNANRILTTADDLHDSAAVQGQIDSAYIRPLARAALVAGNNITYDSSTGVIASTAAGGTDSATVVSIADSRIGVASIGDLSDVDLTGIATDRVLKWDGSKFIVALDATGSGGAGIALTDLDAINTAGKFGSLSYSSGSGVFTYTGPDSNDVKTVTGIPYGNLTGVPNVLDSGNVTSLIDSGITNNILGTANQVTVTTGSKTATIGLPTNVTVDSNLTVGGYIAGPAVFTIDPAAIGDSTGKVVIFGDLQVDGVTTTINSTTVSISDKNIVLADSATNASQANGAGITINGANATIQYAATGDKWVFNKAPYYNTDRILTTADTTDNVTEGSTNLYYTTARSDSDFDIRLASKTTDNVTEGSTNLYYTTARSDSDTRALVDSAYIRPLARAAIVAGSNVSYDSATGVISVAASFDTHDSALVQGQIDAATQFLRSDQSDSMAGSLTIDDDLFVGGRIVSTSDSNISFGDNVILINTATTGNNTLDAGIEIERGLSNNVSFIWDESQDYWSFGTQNVHTTGVMYFANEFQDSTDLPDASTYHGMFAHDHNGNRAVYAHGTWHTLLDATHSTTDQLTEGSTNLYYNSLKVDSDVGILVNTAYVNALNVNADTVDSLQASQFLRSDSDDTMSANLTVTGTITTGSGNNTTVIRPDTGTYDNYSIEHDLDGTSVTLNTATVIDTYTHNSAKTSIEYLIHLEHNTLAETQITKILATYKGSGTDVQFTEFGEIFTGDSSLGALTIDENSGSIRLLLDPRGSEDVISKVVRTVII